MKVEVIPLTAAGVYVISNVVNGKRYIGSTSISFAKRYQVSGAIVSMIKLGKHWRCHHES